MLMRRAEMRSGGEEWSSLKERDADVGVVSCTKPGGVLQVDLELSANSALTARAS